MMQYRKDWLVFVLMAVFLGGCCGPTLVSQDTTFRGQEIRPYVGLVRNFADVDIAMPSANSNATIIVPAQGAVEYTVWQPNFTLFGYANGKEVYCRRMQVQPKKYSVFCKKYDFLAEIYPEAAVRRPALPPGEPLSSSPAPYQSNRQPKKFSSG